MTPPEQERLKECPRGCAPMKLDVANFGRSSWFVRCTCGWRLAERFATEQEAIEWWNTRHTPSVEGGVKVFKTEKWQQGRQWPPEVVLDCGSNMPFDVHAVRDDGWGVKFIRHDLAGQKSSGEMARLLKEVTHHMTLTCHDEEWQWESIRLKERVTATLFQLESKGEV